MRRTSFEPRTLSAEEVGRLPGLALELLRRSWWKLLGLIGAIAVLSEWVDAARGPLALLCGFGSSGLIMAAAFWTARAADRGESLLTVACARGLSRGLWLGLLLGAVYLPWALPAWAPQAATADSTTRPAVQAHAAPLPAASLAESLHRPFRAEASMLGAGITFARDRAAWVSTAAALGVLIIVAAHILGNGLAGGLVFLPVYVLGLSLSGSILMCRRTALKNRAFLRSMSMRSPSILLALNATAGLIVLAPGIVGFLSPLVTLHVMYLGSLSYVTYRAIFEGTLENSPRQLQASSSLAPLRA